VAPPAPTVPAGRPGPVKPKNMYED
jgi:hypothetical protein